MSEEQRLILVRALQALQCEFDALTMHVWKWPFADDNADCQISILTLFGFWRQLCLLDAKLTRQNRVLPKYCVPPCLLKKKQKKKPNKAELLEMLTVWMFVCCANSHDFFSHHVASMGWDFVLTLREPALSNSTSWTITRWMSRIAKKRVVLARLRT